MPRSGGPSKLHNGSERSGLEVSSGTEAFPGVAGTWHCERCRPSKRRLLQTSWAHILLTSGWKNGSRKKSQHHRAACDLLLHPTRILFICQAVPEDLATRTTHMSRQSQEFELVSRVFVSSVAPGRQWLDHLKKPLQPKTLPHDLCDPIITA